MQVTSERRKREMSGLQNAEKILKGRRGGGWFFSKRRIPRRLLFPVDKNSQRLDWLAQRKKRDSQMSRIQGREHGVARRSRSHVRED